MTVPANGFFCPAASARHGIEMRRQQQRAPAVFTFQEGDQIGTFLFELIYLYLKPQPGKIISGKSGYTEFVTAGILGIYGNKLL